MAFPASITIQDIPPAMQKSPRKHSSTIDISQSLQNYQLYGQLLGTSHTGATQHMYPCLHDHPETSGESSELDPSGFISVRNAGLKPLLCDNWY